MNNMIIATELGEVTVYHIPLYTCNECDNIKRENRRMVKQKSILVDKNQGNINIPTGRHVCDYHSLLKWLKMTNSTKWKYKSNV